MVLTIGSLLGLIALIGVAWGVGRWGWRRWTRPLSPWDAVRHDVRLERERQETLRRSAATEYGRRRREEAGEMRAATTRDRLPDEAKADQGHEPPDRDG